MMAYHKPNQIMGQAFAGTTINPSYSPGQYTSTERNIHLMLCDFIDKFIHMICYHRALYHKDMFQPYQMYSTPVRVCRHPLLSQYIDNVTRGIQHQMRINTPFVFCLNIVQPAMSNEKAMQHNATDDTD